MRSIYTWVSSGKNQDRFKGCQARCVKALLYLFFIPVFLRLLFPYEECPVACTMSCIAGTLYK
jgi:hypothetical protein